MSYTVVKMDSNDTIPDCFKYSSDAVKNYHCGYQFGYENAFYISGATGFGVTLATTISAVGIAEWTKISPGTASVIGLIACPILSLMSLHLGLKLSQYPEVQNTCGIACGHLFAAKGQINRLLEHG